MRNSRVILVVEDNIMFAGTFKGNMRVKGKQGVLVELNPKTRLSVWCPGTSVKSIVTVIPEEGEKHG